MCVSNFIHGQVIFIIIGWLLFEIFLMVFRGGSLYSGNCFPNLFILFSFFLFVVFILLLNHLNAGFFAHGTFAAKVLGIVFILGGIALRLISFFTLGCYFTPNVTLQRNQVLVQKGVYRFIRHPGYAGAILLYLGLSFFIANCVILIFSIIWFPLVYSARIREEEKKLVQKLGIEYICYQQRTKKLIPFVY